MCELFSLKKKSVQLQLVAEQENMQRSGFRRLLVLSGERVWCYQQALLLISLFKENSLWIGEKSPDDVLLPTPASKVRHLLGQELFHAVFDTHDGLDAEALAALSGTLKAGSWLICLVPTWEQWENLKDRDTLRWSEQSEPISAPNFVHYTKETLQKDSDVVIWKQSQNQPRIDPVTNCPWFPPDGSPTEEQQRVLNQLLTAQAGVWVLTAGRGRGKSALAGMLAATWSGAGKCWLTAPNQASTSMLQRYAEGKVSFWSPDTLIQHCHKNGVTNVDWLIIDEAAAIPAPLLHELIAFFPRVLLTTTVQGYEGTGRGFILKFCAELPVWHALSLQSPIRWADGDPLERIISQLLLFDDELPALQDTRLACCMRIPQKVLLINTPLLQQWYALLTSAHYRTSPLDLRRLMDAPGIRLSAGMNQDNQLIAALWMVAEGGLSKTLSREIWAGRRRPRGNLVAQSLSAHGGEWDTPALRAWRISRIAVHPKARRQGIATLLIKQQIEDAVSQNIDYLSVSFGYTPSLWAFWQRCGFTLIRIGSQREAGSGCFSAMAVYSLTEAGEKLKKAARRRLERDWPWLSALIPLALPLPAFEGSQSLDDEDWRELAGFAFAHRSWESSFPALSRLMQEKSLPMPLLNALFLNSQSHEDVIDAYGFSGKKALLSALRAETREAIQWWDNDASKKWYEWVMGKDELDGIN